MPPQEPYPNTYLVWSNEHQSWWKPNIAGYTGNIWDAGRYDHTEAAKACDLRTWSPGEPPPEVMVLAPEAGRGPFTAADIQTVPDLMRHRIDEATQTAVAKLAAAAA